MKNCPRCKRSLDKSEFTKDLSTRDKLCLYCRECTKVYRDTYRARRTEAYLASQQASRSKTLSKRRAIVVDDTGSKKCSGCQQIKLHSEYHRNIGYYDGMDAYCKPCRLASNRQVQYGLSPEQFSLMLASQSNQCAICSAEFEKLNKIHVDHDHITGQVRGLLCNTCNFGLGNFKDSTNLLNNAIRYLQYF